MTSSAINQPRQVPGKHDQISGQTRFRGSQQLPTNYIVESDMTGRQERPSEARVSTPNSRLTLRAGSTG